ncbi:MAG TPA: 8-oxo-dGTP diphosphatase MutT [Candidatus Eisenbacteria bacterium]|jgi:mutator protein MutT|nr:8-oxo-dGTP diphosphatase MutT [Candidatus Eisenbacteria bacterium]
MKPKRQPVIPCGIAIIRRDRHFLIAQRCDDDSFGSLWEFPGGKKNHGETFEHCVAREALEELGIKVSVGKKFMELRKTYNEKVIWLNFYLCTLLSGEPRPIECQKVLWVEATQLKNYIFPPANEIVIDRLLDMLGAAK